MLARRGSGPNLRRAALLAATVTVASVGGLYYSGYAQPVLYGCLCWAYAVTGDPRVIGWSKNA